MLLEACSAGIALEGAGMVREKKEMEVRTRYFMKRKIEVLRM